MVGVGEIHGKCQAPYRAMDSGSGLTQLEYSHILLEVVKTKRPGIQECKQAGNV